MKLSIAAGSAETGAGIPLGLLGFQGLLQEAALASRRLRKIAPVLHSELRREPPSLGAQIRRLSVATNPHTYRLQQALSKLDPELRRKRAQQAKPAGLDMVYFLAESQLRPYVYGIAFARHNKATFQAIVNFLS